MGSAADQDTLYKQAAAEFSGALNRLARGYEPDPDKRRDLVQDIHVALWRSFAQFAGADRLCVIAPHSGSVAECFDSLKNTSDQVPTGAVLVHHPSLLIHAEVAHHSVEGATMGPLLDERAVDLGLNPAD